MPALAGPRAEPVSCDETSEDPMFYPAPMPIDDTKILTRRELATVLADAAAKARCSANARGSLVIFRLACCCGLRVSEIAGLQLDATPRSGQ
jgi:integrase